MTVAPKPTSRMAYPFNAKDGKAFADVQDAYAGLALADGGHFPLGNNGHFHGGIHFDRGTANVFSTEEGVQCVADGEIVAYRIDEHYPDATPVADTPLEVGAEPLANADQGQETQATAVLRPYSTGFVLVRHRLQAPPLPAPASDDDLASATVEPDYGTRLATRAHGPTVGWLPLYARVALMELQNGWAKVRIQPPSVATWTREPVAEPWLPLYSLDRLPTTLPNRWFGGEPPVATVVLGSQPKPQPPMCKPAAVIPAPELVLYSLYMHLADGASYQATPDRTPKWWPKKRYRAGLKTKNQWTLNDQLIEGLTVRALDSSTELGILVRGSVIEIEPMAGNDKWGLVRRIVEGGIATQPDGVQLTELQVPGRVYLEELDAFSAPAAFDNIEIPVPPIPFSMGEVIGHLGQQVSSSDTLLANQPASRPMLHLEIFSAEDVPRFLLDSRRYAENLPKQHWTLVRLRQGDPIKAEPRDDAPSVIDLATDWTTGITRHTTVQQDDHQQSWVNVQVLAADGSIVHGWAKDTDRRLTPWHWPGFEVVDAASNQAGTWWDGTASAFVDFLRGGQRPEETPFFKHIRQLMGLNDQGELSEENLDAALQNRALAKRLGGLIAYHTSEWHVPSWAGKYGVISEIAVKLGKWAMDNVKAEKNCVMKLRWWGEVAADVGLPEGAKVYHFHPVALVAAILKRSSCQCGCCIGKVFYRVKYNNKYGPAHAGEMPLESYPAWNRMVQSGVVSNDEKTIIVAMSPNEGNLDSIQSYDSEILTAGAMQKTINPQGQGELYDQVVKFKNRHLTLYDEFFEDCEWSVKGGEFSYRGLTKGALVKEIRKEFSFTSTSGKKESQILAPFLNLIRSDEYVELQVMDFIDRLRLVVSLVPSGQVYQIKQYLASHLGHALVLDHHINRPTYVVRDLGASLLRFFQANPEVSKVPGDWGQYHQSYEKKILEGYGTTRQMTDATARYHALRSRL